ncbi:Short-chain dehydrogenase [Amycolatopsis marina]|uniref:Short-chain dehydrogenase n=1 Tax=Amycolatopsis marina TaxID=490629 RepID=A0A1I0V4X8_9PSEU|nr:SDR family NAD(P)-dependent oxidoreductase [Amycolatopsis marina]SFA71394.1 Short-chain dehydrogenase [Amycolatopsis marina]
MTATETRLWLVTGASRGLGRAFTEAALRNGDHVVATVRRADALTDLAYEWGDRLIRRELDVTDRAAVTEVVDDIADTVGTPDVVVNNAGYGLVGATEEISETEARAQFDTNFFGALWVTQAALPHMRAAGQGRIVQVSSVGAVGAMPFFGLYNATKWALEGFSAALAQEVAPHGIGVHILELGGFATDWFGRSMRFADENGAYNELRGGIFGAARYPDLSDASPAEQGEDATDAPPSVAAESLLELLDLEDPPLRWVAGPAAKDMVRMALEDRRDDYEKDPEFTWPSGSRAHDTPA